MKVAASLSNSQGRHEVRVVTNGVAYTLNVPPKANGSGSGVNGGELLLLAIATCYCNDIYREAAKRGIAVHRVDVTAEADFPAEGQAASNVRYHARLAANAPDEVLLDLMRHTDGVAEIHNSLRNAIPVAAR